MIQVLPFDASLFTPEVVRQAREDFSDLTDEWLKYQVLFGQQGWAFMAVQEGQPLGAAGAALVYPGVAQAWAIFLELHPRIMALIMRRLKIGIPSFCSLHYIRRLQTYINPAIKGTVRLVEYLGMDIEGWLPAFGINGEEWLLYGKVVTHGSNHSP